MKPLSYMGASKVADLLDAGVPLEQIVDSYGRPIHPDAQEFFSYHCQAKRSAIKAAVENLDVRARLRGLEIEEAHREPRQGAH